MSKLKAVAGAAAMLLAGCQFAQAQEEFY